jgi:imidazole glycerol phosphate synthase glutamine amidotransferase subunit
MIAVIDYGAGNVGSVLKAAEYLGFPAVRANTPESLWNADKIILPGQGHFGAMMRALSERKMIEPLRESLHAGKHYLGICLGLQALYEKSDEAPEASGLGVLAGRVRRLEGVFKIPHVGWSQLEIQRHRAILEGITQGSFVYYCHSYYGPVTVESSATTEYGQRFSAVAEAGNICAVQFHPEKSGDVGLRILKNFLSLTTDH